MAIIMSEEITVHSAIPVIDDQYTQQDYDDFIFSLEAGRLFTFEKMSFEDVANNIELAKSVGSLFSFAYAEPGTVLFSVHGANHCIVTHANA